MDQDLQDCLALWLGDHDPGAARRAALLDRFERDDAFRRAFVDEIRMLGMLRAVQSSEPRWLRLEDEIGWSARQSADVDALARTVVRVGIRRRNLRHLGFAAAAILVVAGLVWAWRAGRPLPAPSPEPEHANVEIATAIKFENVVWELGDVAHPEEGSIVVAGRLRLISGRLTLAFFSGVLLTVEGPADLELLAINQVFCQHGKLRARVPRGAEGFTVLAPGYEIVDLGTEFALNLEQGGKSQVMVFEGEAAVSVLGKDGRSVRGVLLEQRRSAEIDSNAGRIQELPPQAESFVPLTEVVPSPLELVSGYSAEILAAKPTGYWRFETLTDGHIPNEVGSRPALLAFGGVTLAQSPGGNHCARFRPNDHAQRLVADGMPLPQPAGGYAIELWAQADMPSPLGFSQSALVGLLDMDDGAAENHFAYIELAARGRRSPHEPCTVRFLDRWPASRSGGANVFSRRTVVPSLWRHIVGQKAGDTLELYIDGECVGTSPVKLSPPVPNAPAPTLCRLLVGRLKQRSLPPHISEIRAFEGWLDELAVYDRPLTLEEIRRHAQMRQAKLEVKNQE